MQKDPDRKSEEGLVSRWSRRKAEVAEHAEQEILDTISDNQSSGELVAHLDPDPAKDDPGQTETSQEKVLTDEDMPAIDSLTEESDFSMFMSPGVSETLRKLALRKLFSGASFNIRDGLDDYDDDFRSFAALGDIITCDMKHQMELEEERKRKQEEAEAAAAEEAKGGEESDEPVDKEIETSDLAQTGADTETNRESGDRDEIEQVALADSNQKSSETSETS
jgi:hypothetical protein